MAAPAGRGRQGVGVCQTQGQDFQMSQIMVTPQVRSVSASDPWRKLRLQFCELRALPRSSCLFRGESLSENQVGKETENQAEKEGSWPYLTYKATERELGRQRETEQRRET